jgi:hypothetical protein
MYHTHARWIILEGETPATRHIWILKTWHSTCIIVTRRNIISSFRNMCRVIFREYAVWRKFKQPNFLQLNVWLFADELSRCAVESYFGFWARRNDVMHIVRLMLLTSATTHFSFFFCVISLETVRHLGKIANFVTRLFQLQLSALSHSSSALPEWNFCRWAPFYRSLRTCKQL